MKSKGASWGYWGATIAAAALVWTAVIQSEPSGKVGLNNRAEASAKYRAIIVDQGTSNEDRRIARLKWGRSINDWCASGCSSADRALGRYLLSGKRPAVEAHQQGLELHGEAGNTSEDKREAMQLREKLYLVNNCKGQSPPRHKHIELVCVPGGEVSVRNRSGQSMTLDVEAFFISRKEVTYRQFEALGGIQGNCDPGHDREQGKWLDPAHKDQPARCVDLRSAREVASKVMAGTLPSEAQLRRAFQAGPLELKARHDEWLVAVPPGETGKAAVPNAARMRFYQGADPMTDGFEALRRRSDTGFRVVVLPE